MVTRVTARATATSPPPAKAKVVPQPRVRTKRAPAALVAASPAALAGTHGALKNMLGLTGERMSKVDTAWLRMDSDANLMMIMGVWIIRPGLDHAALCQRVTERLVPIARFRQRTVEDAAGATWVEDPLFDVHRHVVREALPAHVPAQQALQQRVADLAMQPLNRMHPLWQFHLVEDYAGGAALIARIHHCIADGIALITVMMGLVDGGQAPARRARHAAAGEGEVGGGSANAWLAAAVVRPLSQLALKALDVAGGGLSHSLAAIGQPGQCLDTAKGAVLDVARMGAQLLRDAAALALMADDSHTRFKGKPQAQKAVAWCEPISLDEVKGVGKALGCSVNDVLLSCVAGALGAYLQQQGEQVAGKEIRAMVPVNLRPMDQAWKLGNRFGLVPLVLPIGVDNPIERVFVVRQRMASLKGSTQPLLAFGMLAVAGLLVKPAQEAMLGLFSRKTSAVMTNVPGPAEKLQLCGSTVEQMMFWVPQSGDIGVGVSILSYGGGVQFGLITDTGMCAQPQDIIDQFAPQFASLSWLALMLPWGEEAV